MLFNSFAFIWFMLMAFSLYWWMGRWKQGKAWQNGFLLAISYFFYGWWDVRFLSLIFLSSLTDYLCGLAMAKQDKALPQLSNKKQASSNTSKQASPETTRRRARRPYLWISLAVNLGMLGFFKYFNFFSESLVDALQLIGYQADLPTLAIVLPVGISFYTFQTLSYTLDIYKGKLKPERNFINFFAFVSFFPQLVAGPIERASHLLPQFAQNRKFDYHFAVTGLRLILWGIFKKVVIADRLGEYVDAAYGPDGDFSGNSLILGMVFFSIQIYCDFSGYSDVAIGTARLFGFRLSPNFRSPYLAGSLRNFWERWHISLTTWFRDYVYIPLGGNRVSEPRWWFNIMAIFLVSGFWHGAAWGFLIWGGIHGLFYLVERKLRLAEGYAKTGLKPLGWAVTMLVTGFAWIFFRVPDYADWSAVLQRMSQGGALDLFSAFDSELNLFMSDQGEIIYLSILIAFWFAVEYGLKLQDFGRALTGKRKLLRWGIYYLLAAWLLAFGIYGLPTRFIYFQF